MKLELLISQIQSLDGSLKYEASKAVNRLLTIRNWLIGYYIVEYEQQGEDRAKYGDNLLEILSVSLNIKGVSATTLRQNRLFYILYPHIRQTMSDALQNTPIQIQWTLSAELQTIDNQSKMVNSPSPHELENNTTQIQQTPSAKLEKINMGIWQTPSAQSYEAKLAEKIINRLSFSHITLLLPVDDPLKRAFYALEAIKGTWSVRELKRQINSLLFERSGMSKKPEQLLKTLNEKAEQQPAASFVKDIYAFEFLGLKEYEAVEESDLESALLTHLQQFILEMGNGFCLEARQKRILIGDEYFFIDLVFYHRILKCHVLVDLKVEAFDHNNAGQLDTYINYYKKEMHTPGDNPPIGILMVTHKNEALVEYATAGMDEKLFVRKYMLELPDKKKIEAFIKNELRTL